MYDENENVLENEENLDSENGSDETEGAADSGNNEEGADTDSGVVGGVVLDSTQAELLVNGSLFHSFALAAILGILVVSLFAKGANH